MRKAAMLAGAVVLVIVLFAGAALASGHQCAGRPCTGTNSANTLYERPGNGVPDAIYGRGGRDVLHAESYRRDADRLYGNRGAAKLRANDGDTRDSVSGGPGFDVYKVDSRGEVGRGCEAVRVS